MLDRTRLISRDFMGKASAGLPSFAPYRPGESGSLGERYYNRSPRNADSNRNIGQICQKASTRALPIAICAEPLLSRRQRILFDPRPSSQLKLAEQIETLGITGRQQVGRSLRRERTLAKGSFFSVW